MVMTMKLQQGQVWKQGQEYIRIVRLERLEVEYKSMTSLHAKEGRKLVTSKKDFCWLLKQARLLTPAKNPPAVTISAAR
jgi:ABC-type Zn uptake system ZnuABC Zn-binding protein ZnuA